jgi:transposase InsO family protein
MRGHQQSPCCDATGRLQRAHRALRLLNIVVDHALRLWRQLDLKSELWFADLTYLRCWEGVVYFAFVIDAYSRAIVGWQFATHMRTDLVLDALRMALAQRAPGADVALVQHSDASSQYTSYDYSQILDDHGVLA